MKDGNCPKCAAKEIYRSDDGIGTNEFSMLKRKGFGWSETTMDSYLCTNCGYFENYIKESEHLNQVKKVKSWIKVSSWKNSAD